MSRRTNATIIFNGTDITEDISPYLTSLTYTDNEEDEADDLQISLQDRNDKWLADWLAQTINADTNSSTNSGITSENISTGGANYTVNAPSGLNMRTGAGMNYSIIRTLPYGSSVLVTGSDGDWSIVDNNGQSAYMWTGYLSLSSSSSETGNVSSYPLLSFGSQGDAVKTMQSLLVKKGQSLPKYGVDGYFGSETQSAVQAFQSSVNITVDGICGDVTWAKLLEDSTNSGTSSNKAFYISATINRIDWNDGNSNVLDCGQFELDAIDVSSPPSTVIIKATSLPYTSQIRQTKKSKAWENYTLSGIAQEMASNNGMICMYESSYNPTYAHIEQFEESDIAFLSRLSHNTGISVKATNNIIVLFDQLTYENLSSVLTINRKSTDSYISYKLSTSEANTQYASCRVRYTDPNTGNVIEAIAKVSDYDTENKNNQQLECWAKVNSIGEAMDLATKKLRYHNKYSKTASFSVLGNPNIIAGVCIDLVGFGLWSGKYIVKQAKHSVSSSGYTTQIELRNVLENY